MMSNLKKLSKGMIIVIIAILITSVILGLIFGCAKTMLCIPVWILMYAFNAIVPAFGGPTLTFKMASGALILIIIAVSIIRSIEK